MKINQVLQIAAKWNEKALYPSDLKGAIIGLVERFGMEPQILLDRQKCLEILAKNGMTIDEAKDYFEYNVLGSGMGDEGSPCFATLIQDL